MALQPNPTNLHPFASARVSKFGNVLSQTKGAIAITNLTVKFASVILMADKCLCAQRLFFSNQDLRGGTGDTNT